jgi:hypothetical protein
MWSASKSAEFCAAQLYAVAIVPPVPLSVSWCGLPGASSVMLTLADREPDALGVKVTEIEQDAPAASVLGVSGQVVVRAKSVALAPVIDMLLIVSGPLPVFLSVDDCAALVVAIDCVPNVRLPGVSETAGPGGGEPVLPVPLNPSECGLPEALSVMLTLAEREPDAPGVNVTETEQEAPAASEAGQLDVSSKSAAFVPVTDMPVITSGALPVFVSVEDLEALVEPTVCDPNDRLCGLSDAPGAGGGGAPVLTVRTASP